MPEPNLPFLFVALGPISHGCVSVDEIKKNIPELPEQTRTYLQTEHALTAEQAIILVVCVHIHSPCSNWLIRTINASRMRIIY